MTKGSGVALRMWDLHISSPWSAREFENSTKSGNGYRRPEITSNSLAGYGGIVVGLLQVMTFDSSIRDTGWYTSLEPPHHNLVVEGGSDVKYAASG